MGKDYPNIEAMVRLIRTAFSDWPEESSERAFLAHFETYPIRSSEHFALLLRSLGPIGTMKSEPVLGALLPIWKSIGGVALGRVGNCLALYVQAPFIFPEGTSASERANFAYSLESGLLSAGASEVSHNPLNEVRALWAAF